MKEYLVVICLLFVVASTDSVVAKAIAENPATIVELAIDSDDSRMPGHAYLAAGKEPHPTILLLHGYPGNEKNLDVAQALRRQGWNVLFFHYRGAWGSEGDFSFRGAEQDVQVVLNYMMEKDNAAKLRIDRSKISLVGHSMGGHMAIAGILGNQAVKCSVAYDGVNIGKIKAAYSNNPKRKKGWLDYADQLFMLNNWSGEKADKELTEYSSDLDLLNHVDKINGRPVQLISANTQVIPVETHIMPLYEALKATKNSNVSYITIEDDHSFSSTRLELIDATAKFLNSNCRD